MRHHEPHPALLRASVRSTPSTRSTRGASRRGPELLTSCAWLLALGVGCSRGAPLDLSLPGGAATLEPGARPSFWAPVPALEGGARARFHAGKALAHQPWVRAPSITDARDGLGPLYNARACTSCHVRGGRGTVAFEDGPLAFATLVRTSMEVDGEWVPDPIYGGQIQARSVDLLDQLRGHTDAKPELPAEAEPHVEWVSETFRYPDGREVELRAPRVRLERLGYGPLDARSQLGLRHAPSLHGLGLVDRIPTERLAVRADPEDADGDGVSGRLPAGRFGWKGQIPTLREQIADAFRNDIGITSRLRPEPPCTPAQTACLAGPHGDSMEEGHELSEALMDLVEGFVADIGVPPRRVKDEERARTGKAAFLRAGCAACHVPEARTGADAEHPYLSEQVFRPYSDFLLHDLGPGLAETRRVGNAEGAEWRTAPLWGVGWAFRVNRRTGLLHDGRARSVEEAILWHQGEALGARTRFVASSAAEREALVDFVDSL